jgi:hypothetical protein
VQAIFQSQSLYKNWPKSKKKKSKNQKQNKSRDLHKDYNYWKELSAQQLLSMFIKK